MCAFDTSNTRHFVLRKDAPVDFMPYGRDIWLCSPEIVATQQLLVVEVHMQPGTAHAFHRHPGREELLWIIEGEGEQWVKQQRMLLGAGDSAFIPMNTVHGIYNDSERLLRFLAVLSPAKASEPLVIDVQHEEPWLSLRAPLQA
jgi:quercetin dioxygenase-like cupin family protein